MRNFLPLTLILLFGATEWCLAGPAESSSWRPDYTLFDLYQYHQSSDILLQQTCGVTAGKYFHSSHVVYEWQRPMITFVRFLGRRNKDRVAATPLVMALSLGVTAWTMAIAGCSEEQIDAAAVALLQPFGPHLGYRPHQAVTLFAGVVPDIVLFTEDDGLLLQWRAGCRIDVNKRIVVNAGVAQTALCGFRHKGGLFPLGVSVGISLAPVK